MAKLRPGVGLVEVSEQGAHLHPSFVGRTMERERPPRVSKRLRGLAQPQQGRSRTQLQRCLTKGEKARLLLAAHRPIDLLGPSGKDLTGFSRPVQPSERPPLALDQKADSDRPRRGDLEARAGEFEG